MKLVDLHETTYDEPSREEVNNPIPFDKTKVFNAFELANDVEDELVKIYKKERGITEFNSLRDYGKAAQIQREKYGSIENVLISDLIASEEKVYPDQLRALVKGDNVKSSSELPLVYKTKNDYIIGDGNHRAIAAAFNGEESIKALVLDLDKLSQIK